MWQQWHGEVPGQCNNFHLQGWIAAGVSSTAGRPPFSNLTNAGSSSGPRDPGTASEATLYPGDLSAEANQHHAHVRCGLVRRGHRHHSSEVLGTIQTYREPYL